MTDGIMANRLLDIEEAQASSFYAEELAILASIPDGQDYYDYVVNHVQLDRSNPKNSYYMFIHGKVDQIDLTRPCLFTGRATALPDIDVDFPTDYREKAIEYVRDKYGPERVCQISTFGRLSGRSALKAVMRAEGLIDQETMNEITAGIPDEAAISDKLEESGDYSIIRWVLENPDLATKMAKKATPTSNFCRIEDEVLVGDYAETFTKAIALEGTFQVHGKHAAGVIISSDVISDVSPMCLSSDNVPIAAMDMGDLEKLGLVKFDFLGVDILNKIQEAYGLQIVNVPLDDDEAWDVIASGNTKGCFQIESHLGREWSMNVKPHNIEELAAVISVIRPGCVSKDTQIAVMSNYKYKKNGKKHIKNVSIEQLYKNKNHYKMLKSVDSNLSFINHNMIDIFYTGQKECFKLKIRKYRKLRTVSFLGASQYNLECTIDHKLLTPKGWTELQNLQIGDRIAARKISAPLRMRNETASSRHVAGLRVKNCIGLRNFSDICYKNYLEECCICGWDKANLDTNHIEGNRFIDNSPDNLCFLCPNCHREFTLGYISKEALRAAKANKRLHFSEDIDWITYEGCESVGIKDVYDISMEAPHHNFIAGNIVVHNCLLSKSDDGRSMTQVYSDRKNGIEVVPDTPINKVINTHGVLIYQETLLNICKHLAGFNSAGSISMMKSVGKKDAKKLFALEEQFLAGCNKIGIITDVEAKALFANIRHASRYLFNASHAISYSFPAYWSAYIKAHTPLKFYEVWLKYSKNKKKEAHAEVRNLVLSARMDNIEILPPSCEYLTEDCFIRGESVVFGVSLIKGASTGEITKLFNLMKLYGVKAPLLTYLIDILPNVNKTTVEALITCGCFSYLGYSRAVLQHEYECVRDLTDKELAFIAERKFESLETALIATAVTKKEGGGCATAARVGKVNAILERLRNPGRILHDLPSKIAASEEALIGITLSCSYIDSCLKTGVADTTCKEIRRGKPGKRTLVVRVLEVKEHVIKSSGKTMAFIVVEDDSTQLDNVVCFADQYELYNRILYEDAFVSIFGELGKQNSFVIERCIEL
jgi:DNA polymerase III alpha subunit